MRLLPMGPTAVLVENLDVAPALFAAAIGDALGPAVAEVVPGASTVLVVAAPGHDLDAVAGRLADVVAGSPDATSPRRVVEIPVTYDGPDLGAVAEATGATVADVIELHSGGDYHVDFCGFAPGFGYLSGLPERLHLPRRTTPRTRVPAGSVAIAASYSAVYPTASPGGWHLLGTTTTVMFDPDREPPALLSPGVAVRFTVA